MWILPVCKSLSLHRTSWDPSAELKRRFSFQAEPFPKCFREYWATDTTSTLSAAVGARCGFERIRGISVLWYVPWLIDSMMSEQMKAPARLQFYEEHVEIKKFAVFETQMSSTVWCAECFSSAWEATRMWDPAFVCFIVPVVGQNAVVAQLASPLRYVTWADIWSEQSHGPEQPKQMLSENQLVCCLWAPQKAPFTCIQ